jgi:MFS family permease
MDPGSTSILAAAFREDFCLVRSIESGFEPVPLVAVPGLVGELPVPPRAAAAVSEQVVRPATTGVAPLAALFGAMYFLQGIAEPTDGLVVQPVRALLKSWSASPTSITGFAALLAIPWALKPLYGLLTDFVPLAGRRRKSYLVAMSMMAACGFFALTWFPPAQGAYVWLLASLLLPTIGVAFSDVVVDALMVERGQPGGITGVLQSVQWAAIYTASILTGVVGGYLSGHQLYQAAFLLCALAALITLAVTVCCIHEPRRTGAAGHGPSARVNLAAALHSPAVRMVCLFFFLFEFNPFSSTVLYLHMTEDMQFSEEFYGLLRSIGAVGSILGCVSYGLYCRRLSLRQLVHLSIALGILSSLAYLALAGETSACIVSFTFGFLFMTATLIQLHLAAQTCPALAAGTVFALIMSLSNVSSSLSTWVGGYLYQLGIEWWGHTASFNVLVVIGAACTAACWLVVPRLPSRVLD